MTPMESDLEPCARMRHRTQVQRRRHYITLHKADHGATAEGEFSPTRMELPNLCVLVPLPDLSHEHDLQMCSWKLLVLTHGSQISVQEDEINQFIMIVVPKELERVLSGVLYDHFTFKARLLLLVSKSGTIVSSCLF
jgi:hypothetical protein